MTDSGGTITNLIDRVAGGSQGAANQFFEVSNDRVVRLVRSLWGPSRISYEDAEEIAADAVAQFLKLLVDGNWRGMPSRQRAFALLRTIAERRAVDFVRRMQPPGVSAGDLSELLDATSDEALACLALTDEIESRLRDCTSGTSRNRLLELAELLLSGQSDREIAESLNVSLRTVARRKDLLREQLIVLGIFPARLSPASSVGGSRNVQP